ncbi:VOC family protein [Gellertiella hungarica]|uniref:Catechol 2,3-dioxygenase-like lactoylglutathione lyase family enzyme n=1 Tax=Gellertiella hungarica TaxID=1572859 RepID=A0A7W6J622_9HYPH|nr:VOC family protein [Gellertiella hungarica]MBB4064608.1 catechol 2,3-dioxygenase-like lactoylglutathione lyase family enzyme [Gellertiella hungarica]
MTIQGLNHVNIRAEQPLLDSLRDFYCHVLGLREGERPPFPSPGYWLYAGQLPVVHLYEARPGENRPTVQRGPVDHFAFDAVDPSAVAARLRSMGVPFERKTLPAMGQVQIFLIDPAGNRVELQFPPATAADGLDDGA